MYNKQTKQTKNIKPTNSRRGQNVDISNVKAGT